SARFTMLYHGRASAVTPPDSVRQDNNLPWRNRRDHRIRARSAGPGFSRCPTLPSLRDGEGARKCPGKAFAIIGIEKGADRHRDTAAGDGHGGDSRRRIAGNVEPRPEGVKTMLQGAAGGKDLPDLETAARYADLLLA